MVATFNEQQEKWTIRAINEREGCCFVQDPEGNWFCAEIFPIKAIKELKGDPGIGSALAMDAGFRATEVEIYKDKIYDYLRREKLYYQLQVQGKRLEIPTYEEYLEDKKKGIVTVLKRANPKGIEKIMLPHVEKIIEKGELELAECYLDPLNRLPNITKYDDTKKAYDNYLKTMIDQLNNRYEEQKKIFGKPEQREERILRHTSELILDGVQLQKAEDLVVITFPKVKNLLDQGDTKTAMIYLEALEKLRYDPFYGFDDVKKDPNVIEGINKLWKEYLEIKR